MRGASQSKAVCLTRSGVGRTPLAGSKSISRERKAPPMMRKRPGERFMAKRGHPPEALPLQLWP
jgi:hypothetical protein